MGKRLTIFLVVFTVGLVAPVLAQGTDPNLMGWWKFDGDALDSSGHNRNGVLTGDATYGPGLFDQTLVLDGNGDYVTITGYKGILGGNPFTIALWVNSPDTGDATMVNWGSSTNGQRVDFRLYQGRLRVEHGNGNLQGNTVLNDGQWHHVALTVRANASISHPDCKLYLDGKDDSQTTTDADTFNITGVTDVTIGRRGTNSDRAIEGLLDDVRIYDRELTAAEVAELALRPRAYKPDPADGAEGVGMPLFSWMPRQSAVWHAIYIGTSPDLGPDQLVQPQCMGTTYWHAAGLEPGMSYYWKVDEVDPDGTVYPGDVWSFMIAPREAWQPFPADSEPYTDTDLTLSWRLGLDGVTHDVYFGTDEAAVAEGADDTFKGNQALLTFPTGPLAPDTRYSWRIDEVDTAGEKVPGKVWSFRTLPEIPVGDPNLVAWWTFDEGAGVRAVDWSGHGHHAQLPASGAGWAQGYEETALEFDGSADEYLEATGYVGVLGKTDRTNTAWIQTTQVGDILFWGLQTTGQKWRLRVQDNNGNPGSLRVECEGGRICGWTDLRDGEWHHVAAVLESAGAPTILDVRLYVDGVQEAISDSASVDIDTVDGGRNVRIANGYQNYPFLGLIDDIRIYDRALTQDELNLVMRIDPLRAWQPQPANHHTVDIRSATPLTWEAGDGAVKHDVYLGTDEAAVASATTDTADIYRGRLSTTHYEPGEDLVWGGTCFWRVDEVGADGAVTPGQVWEFTVSDYLLIDDFESYTDAENEGKRIYETWIDGYSDGSSGSTVGNLDPPFAERTIVHGGAQSMPLDYNNVVSPWYSEAALTWDTGQDWTPGDVNTLLVYFRGQAPAFLEADGTITLTAAGWDIWHDSGLTRFDEFRFVYKRLNGDGTIIARVDSVTNTNAWAKAGVMIREDLDWASRHASVFMTPGQGVAFQRRLANNDVGVSTAQAGITAPHWVKLVRSGNTLTAQHSDDGVTWGDVVHATNPTSDTVVMGGTIYIGLALTSHAENVACTAVFSGVEITGGVSGSWQMAEIGVPHPGNAPAPLYLTVKDTGGRTATVTHPDPQATLVPDWQPWAIDLNTLGGGVKVNAVKELQIGVGDRASQLPDGTGRVYFDDIRITKGVPVEPNAPVAP
jgi:regulation of enolase protein 1 (concanavalin A-like superfamily)